MKQMKTMMNFKNLQTFPIKYWFAEEKLEALIKSAKGKMLGLEVTIKKIRYP